MGCARESKVVDEVERPNIIIILTDDQGWGDLSIHGNTNLSTPHIDSLAIEGAVFDNFYVQPVCSPTRAELLTGMYFPRLGVYSTSAGGERMDVSFPTLADYFLKSGYATAAYGKWHNGMQPPYHPNSRGFEDFYGFCSGHWGNYFSPMLEHNGEIVKGEGFLVDDFVNHGIDFISKHQEQPFLLYLPLNTPHSPMQVPDVFWSKFEDRELQKRYQNEDAEDLQFTKAALAMVENIDWNVGRLTSYLKQNDLDKNTIVVFMSDNGPNGWRWNGGLKGKKGSTDEGGVKSPFFIKWPASIDSGQHFEQVMGSVDLLPTLLGLASVESPKDLGFDGRDFSSLIRGQGEQIKDRAIFNHWNNKTSVRTQSYRLDSENRLYNIFTDPGQTTDLSLSHSKLRDSLIILKNKWIEEVATTERGNQPFTLGHTDFDLTQLPARDGEVHGNIKRSNRWPNDSFFTNWKSVQDSITWDIEVLKKGTFEVILYYTCEEQDIGAELELGFKDSAIRKKVVNPHSPPLIGAENDRFPRMESYVKDFIPISLGDIHLEQGKGTLVLKATEIPGDEVIDFRLLQFVRLDEQ
ncbi:arylsulfatase [Flagellimonas algicola]|uniref:Arylsulfatase n=2 Tax=Flagellimonas algicola TaxID=2583815 RepID=A0ABY2WRP3_9FLAO|nr:arylsulfatase [Allomuricauda algicola]